MIWGTATNQVAILAAAVCVVMVDKPLASLREAVQFFGIYLAGCLWATLLGPVVWRIHPLATSQACLGGRHWPKANGPTTTPRFEAAPVKEWKAPAKRFSACRIPHTGPAPGSVPLPQSSARASDTEHGRYFDAQVNRSPDSGN